jgi:hypothetical protein
VKHARELIMNSTEEEEGIAKIKMKNIAREIRNGSSVLEEAINVCMEKEVMAAGPKRHGQCRELSCEGGDGPSPAGASHTEDKGNPDKVHARTMGGMEYKKMVEWYTEERCSRKPRGRRQTGQQEERKILQLT